MGLRLECLLADGHLEENVGIGNQSKDRCRDPRFDTKESQGEVDEQEVFIGIG